MHGSGPNFMGSYLCTISPEHLFPFSKLSEFNIIFSFLLTRHSTGAKINQDATPTVFIRPEPNFMINKVVMTVI